jgi:hypothetical protein
MRREELATLAGISSDYQHSSIMGAVTADRKLLRGHTATVRSE